MWYENRARATHTNPWSLPRAGVRGDEAELADRLRLEPIELDA